LELKKKSGGLKSWLNLNTVHILSLPRDSHVRIVLTSVVETTCQLGFLAAAAYLFTTIRSMRALLYPFEGIEVLISCLGTRSSRLISWFQSATQKLNSYLSQSFIFFLLADSRERSADSSALA
jgi:hypothetical protein